MWKANWPPPSLLILQVRYGKSDQRDQQQGGGRGGGYGGGDGGAGMGGGMAGGMAGMAMPAMGLAGMGGMAGEEQQRVEGKLLHLALHAAGGQPHSVLAFVPCSTVPGMSAAYMPSCCSMRVPQAWAAWA